MKSQERTLGMGAYEWRVVGFSEWAVGGTPTPEDVLTSY
jgi:hypothetical protein